VLDVSVILRELVSERNVAKAPTDSMWQQQKAKRKKKKGKNRGAQFVLTPEFLPFALLP
jgi:hypothetical protein